MGGRLEGEVGMDKFGLWLGEGMIRVGGLASGWYEAGGWGISLEGMSLSYEGEW